MEATKKIKLFCCVRNANNKVIFPKKDVHLDHINNNKEAYDALFTNQNALIEAIKDAHNVWCTTKEACILNVSHINTIANLIHKTDKPLFLPFDIDLKGVDNYEPTHKDMVLFINTLKELFSNSLVFAYVSKSGKGIHFAINVDKKAFSSVEAFQQYLYSLETRVCSAFFGLLLDTIDTEKIFDSSLYNISEKGVSYKNLTISLNSQYAPYFNPNETTPYLTSSISHINTVAKYDIVEKKHLAVEIKDDTPIANKTVNAKSIIELIQSNDGRLTLARYIASGNLSIERVKDTIEPTRKNMERLRELKATVKNAIQKGIKQGCKYEQTQAYDFILTNDIKSNYDKLNPIIGSKYIYPSDYLEAVKGAKTVFVVSENTGAGKTTTLINAYKDNCLYIVPNVSVLEQLEQTLKLNVLHSKKQTPDTFYKLTGRVGITYAYFNELVTANEQYFLNHIANTFNAIIYDEVDYVTQGIMLNIEKTTHYVIKQNDKAQVVFCTATPFKCSLIHDFCEKRVKFLSGNNIKRNVTFYKFPKKNNNNKYLSVITAFLDKNKDATNIIYLNNRRLCKRIKDTLTQYDIKLYNSEIKEFNLDAVYGNMLVTSSITAGLNMYVKDINTPVNFLILGNDLTNSLVKQITGRIRNVNVVNLYLEHNSTHKNTANQDVRYIYETKAFCDLQLKNINQFTNINSLIEFVQRKFIYYINDVPNPLSISFFWNKTVDKYNCEVFKVLNKNNFAYSEEFFEVDKCNEKLKSQDIESFDDIDRINQESDKEFGKLNGLLTQASLTYNIEITETIQKAISILTVLSVFFEKQKNALNIFKGLYYTFVQNFNIISECFEQKISGINNEVTLTKLVEYNVITSTVANALTKNKKYKELYRELFLITHTRKGNLLTFKHASQASVASVFINNFIEVASVKLSKRDIESLELFLEKNKDNNILNEYVKKDLQEFLINTHTKVQEKQACEGAV